MPTLPDGTDGALALALVGTIAHDGNGGIADRFAEDAGVAAWLAEHFPELPARTAEQAERLRALRGAARTAFAATVPGEPDPTGGAAEPTGARTPPKAADRARSAELLTAAVAGLAARLTIDIDAEGLHRGRATATTGQPLLEGMLALAVVDFLAGPLALRLRSCRAPRCVRYFVQDHGRQHWCKTSCGNRARAARFARRHR